MSLVITPIPTASGMVRALDYSSTGIKVEGHFIGVGKGLQSIEIDDAGRAITSAMKTPVAWLPILTSTRVSGYQHQMVVDLAGVSETEWNLSELCLADESKQAIAIYGHATQAMMTVTPIADSSLIAINLVLGSFPAGSIEIIHQGAPLELFMTDTVMRVVSFIGSTTLANMESYLDRRAHAVAEAERRAEFEAVIQLLLEGQNQNIRDVLSRVLDLENKDQSQFEQQQVFNQHASMGIGRLSESVISGVIN